MANSNLAQIEAVFHEAMSYDPPERRRYLDRACAGNAVMLREVESLVNAYDSSSGLLDETAVTLAMKVIGSRPDDSMIGLEVGVYKILSELGQGGMGTVYLAEDMRLNRKVALKFLSSDFISDNWAKRQLVKEAQAVAMLDHPNICAIYDFQEVGEHSFIVMQYIEGETLADLIHGDALKTSQIVPLARQIVSALDNAHAHGIIHRDIKPRNIMVTPKGQVKVLDFGLAKTNAKTLEETTESISQLSQDGLLVGTIAYMSPEQLRGEKLDYRSDIFSMGTVLYEMVSGKNPHAHKTNAEVISAIMSRDPKSLRQVSINCPRGLDQIVNRCLQKERDHRYQSATELLIDLDNLHKGGTLASPINQYLNIKYATLLAALLLLALVIIAIRQNWRRSEQTLALLPIQCESAGSPCIGDTVTEDLLRTLSRRKGLHVVKSSIAPSFYGPQAASPEKVGRDLSVEAVMYGRVIKGENGLYLNVRWQRVADGTRIGEENYPLNPDRASLIGQQLALDTAAYLHLPMDEQDRSIVVGVAAQENRNVDAVELYRAGRTYWSTRDYGDSLKKAADSFYEAAQKDPNFAKAWAGVSDCYVLMNTVAYDPPTRKEAMTRAEFAAKQALEIDPNLAEAHNSMAAILMKKYWDWEGAEREFKRALALNPGYAPARWGYSNLLMTTGRADQAIAEGEIAKDLDPLASQAQLNYCRLLFFGRKFDQAFPCYDRVMAEHPNFSAGKYALGMTYEVQGRYEEAIRVFEPFYQKDPKMGAMLGYSYGMAGRLDDARRVLERLKELQLNEGLPPQELALVYLGMKDLDHAVPLFRQSVEERYPPSQSLFMDPFYDGLRADPRFADIIRDVKPPLISASGGPASNLSAK